MGFWFLLIGTVLTLFAAGVLYISFRAARFPAVQRLTGGRRSLARLNRELTFALRPLPDLLADLRAVGPAGDFFAACREGLEESWAEAWQTALEETHLPLQEEDRQILREAGEVLGRYDGGSQGQALEGLTARLEENLAQARGDEDRLFRVYLALGITAGLFGCILL